MKTENRSVPTDQTVGTTDERGVLCVKYAVKLTEKNVGFLSVDAESQAEVEESAMDKYLRGETQWDGTYLDFEIQDPESPGDDHAGN